MKAKKEKVEMPQVESKTLYTYEVTRRVCVEFVFRVNAESEYEAESIVEELSDVCEYTDTFGMDYQDQYYDADYSIAKIESVEAGSSWFPSRDEFDVQHRGDSNVELFKTEEHDWDDTDHVYDNEESVIDAWKDENGIDENDDENDDNDENEE